jgi:hypothetical protein
MSLVLMRVGNPIDWQGHRSKVKVTGSIFLGEGIRHALHCPCFNCHEENDLYEVVSTCLETLQQWQGGQCAAFYRLTAISLL